MRKTTFTEHQIISILKQQESGIKVADLCREHGISDATFYNWKAKYGGMDASQLKMERAGAILCGSPGIDLHLVVARRFMII